MALAYDATAGTNKYHPASNTIAWNHTCSTGTNRVLIVCVGLRGDGESRTISSATYNSIAMTSAGYKAYGTHALSQIFYLVNPATGTNAVSIAASGGTDLFMCGGSVSFTGADQAEPIIGFTSAQGVDTSPTISVVSYSDEIVVDALVHRGAGDANATVGSGQTQRQQQWATTNDSGNQSDRALLLGVSTETGSSSTTMSWALGAGAMEEWITCALAVKPANGLRETGGSFLLNFL